MSLFFKDVSRRILKEEKPQSNINLERAQRKRNDRIINASLLIRTWIRHWGLLSLNANVQWKRPCTMPSGILFDVVSRYPPGFLCVPVDLYTGLPTRLLISMDASPEPSHSSVEKGDGEGGKSRLDVGRTFILYLYRSPVCFIVLVNKSLREKLFHLTESPERRMPNSLKRDYTHTWKCSLSRALLLPFRNATVLSKFHFHSNFLPTVHRVPSCREQLNPCSFVGSIGFVFLWG